MKASGPRVGLNGVAKRYQLGSTTVTALDGVDMDIADGEFVVILGPSGCGKTTLLNLIGALDVPTEGTIRLDGVDVGNASARQRYAIRRRTVSFVFQRFNLFAGLTALENVQFRVDVSGRDGSPQRAAETLERVGLGDRLRHFPHELSGGEQQRVAIARAPLPATPSFSPTSPRVSSTSPPASRSSSCSTTRPRRAPRC